MKNYTKILYLLVSTFAMLLLCSVKAGAVNVEIPNDLPSGSTELDDNDRLVNVSSQRLAEIIHDSEEVSQNSDKRFGAMLTAVNFADRSWVYYSERTWNLYKVGHSNYLNRSHASYAQVGSAKSGWFWRGGGVWSFATAKGKGTFVAKYN